MNFGAIMYRRRISGRATRFRPGTSWEQRGRRSLILRSHPPQLDVPMAQGFVHVCATSVSHFCVNTTCIQSSPSASFFTCEGGVALRSGRVDSSSRRRRDILFGTSTASSRAPPAIAAGDGSDHYRHGLLGYGGARAGAEGESVKSDWVVPTPRVISSLSIPGPRWQRIRHVAVDHSRQFQTLRIRWLDWPRASDWGVCTAPALLRVYVGIARQKGAHVRCREASGGWIC